LKRLFDNIFVIFLAGVFFFVFNSVSSASELTFAQISDAHYTLIKANTSYRLNAESENLLIDAINQINMTPDINFVMFSGDMINRARKEELYSFIDIANTLKYPWYAIFGNHDINIGGYLSKKKCSQILSENNPTLKDYNKPYYSFVPKKGFKVIALDTVIDTKITTNGEIDKEQLKWLDKELSKSKNDVVLIFMHVPAVEPFSSSSHKLLNDDEFLNILSKYKNPIGVFSGHYHATKIIPRGNIIFVSTPSLVSYPNSFRIVKVKNNRNNVIFDIKFKETSLKDAQQLAKMLVMQSSMYYGEDDDRDFVYKINK
jgi:3',5'-cyclic AMP phosphodiesterase CpdA